MIKLFDRDKVQLKAVNVIRPYHLNLFDRDKVQLKSVNVIRPNH